MKTKYYLTMSNRLIGTVTSEINQYSSYSPVVNELVQFLRRHVDMQHLSYAFQDNVSEGVTQVTISKQVVEE